VGVGSPIAAFRINREALKAQRQLYAADMLLAQQAVENSNIGHARALLGKHQPNQAEADLRGWEWRYLWTKTRGENVASFSLYSNSVSVVCFLPDGQRIASVGDCALEDGIVKVWDLTNRQPVRVLTRSASGCGLATARAASIVVSGGSDGVIRLWHTTDWRSLGELSCGSSVLIVALSADGRYCAGAGATNVWLWETTTRRLLQQWPASDIGSWVSPMAFSPDGRFLAVGETNVTLWDVLSGAKARTLESESPFASNEGIIGLAFSPDGETLAAGSYVGLRGKPAPTIGIWDVSTGKLRRMLNGHLGWVGQPSFSPDGKRLATPGVNQVIRLCRTDTWEAVRSLRGHTFEVSSVSFSPDGRLLASASGDGSVKLWDVSAPEAHRDLDLIPAMAKPGAGRLAPDGTAVLCVDKAGNFTIRSVPSFKEIRGYHLHLTNAEQYALGPAGKRLAWADPEGVIRMRDFATEQVLPDLQAGGRSKELHLSQTGNELVALLADNTVKVWHVGQPQCWLSIPARRGRFASPEITALKFSHRGDLLVVGYSDRQFALWNLVSRNSSLVQTKHKSHVRGLAFSPDDQTIFTAGYDAQIQSWDRTGRPLVSGVSGGQLTGFWNLAISPDGTRLAAAGPDATVTVWDTTVHPLLQVAKLICAVDPVQDLAFSSDQETLVYLGWNSFRVWSARTLAQIDAGDQKH
jgi:WD40 repeat protein